MKLLPLPVLVASLGCAVLRVSTAQSTWTVDDNAPADFSSLQTAVDSVAAGDILLIQPGSYGSVAMNKALTLLGKPSTSRPALTILTISSVPRFELSHLDLIGLSVSDVSGHALVDDCVVHGIAATFSDCADLAIARSTFQPSPSTGLGRTAVNAEFCAWLQFVDCQILGGFGQASGSAAGLGGLALNAGASNVLVAGSTVRGGAGQNASVPFTALGQGGAALWVSAPGAVEIRGSSTDRLEGGPNHVNQLPGGPTGFAALVFSQASAVVSGTTVIGPLGGNATVVSARPYTEWGGTGGPGSSRTLKLHGSAGDVGVYFLAADADLDYALRPLIGVPLLVSPGSILLSGAVVLLGQDSGAGPTFLLPATPAFAGTSFVVQAGALASEGSVAGTNAAELLLSF